MASRFVLVFESKEDCDYFVSGDADHWWYLSCKGWYGAVRIGPTEIEVNECYRPVFLDPFNRPSIHKGLKGKVVIKA